MVAMLSVGITACSSDDDEGDNLDGIWVETNSDGTYDTWSPWVLVFEKGKCFNENLYWYTNKRSFLESYNNMSNWFNCQIKTV